MSDVACRIVLFCQKHDLELSVKSGGYGTHGWAVAGQVVVDLSLMSAIAISLPDSPQSPLPPLRSMKLSVNRDHERSDAIRNTSGQVTSIITDSKGKGKDQGHGAGDGPEAGMASPPMAYNAGFGFGEKQPKPDLSGKDGESIGNGNGKRNSNSTKRSVSEAWRGDETSQPRQNSGSSAFRKPSLGSRHSSGQRNDSSEGVLDAASKKSMMDGLGGATEYEPTYESAHGSFQSSTPLNFGSALPPMMHANGSFPMPGSGSSLDPRWQFGSSSSAYAASQGMFDPTYAMGYPGAQGLGGISNSYFGRQVSSESATPSASGSGSRSGSGSQAGTSNTSLFSHMSPRSLPPYTVVTFGSGATAKQIDKASHFSPWGAFHVPLAAFPVGSAVMMTGGFGFLGRLHGLSMDNLLEIEYVLSDGRIVWLSGMDEKNEGMVIAVENPDGTEGQLSEQEGKDLWFAIRGAGTTMGIATRYRAKAYHVPVVYAGNLI
jgi:hypothetical protein